MSAAPRHLAQRADAGAKGAKLSLYKAFKSAAGFQNPHQRGKASSGRPADEVFRGILKILCCQIVSTL